MYATFFHRRRRQARNTVAEITPGNFPAAPSESKLDLERGSLDKESLADNSEVKIMLPAYEEAVGGIAPAEKALLPEDSFRNSMSDVSSYGDRDPSPSRSRWERTPRDA